jgi:uncharacterized protein YuzE
VVRVIYEYQGKIPVVITVYFLFAQRYFGGGGFYEDKNSRDADVLIIKLREGKPSDSRDIAEGIIVHLTAKGQPLEIEILDASKVVQKKDIEVSLGGLFP